MNSPHLHHVSEALGTLVKHLQKWTFLRVAGESFSYGPAGELVLENVRKEWLYSVCNYREHNVYPFSSFIADSDDLTSGFLKGFEMANALNNGEIPFDMVDSRVIRRSSTGNGPLRAIQPTQMKHWSIQRRTESRQFFYRWLQQRKRWWRKFSADPNRISFSEEKTDSSDVEEAKILANFTWGTHQIESIKYLGSRIFETVADDPDAFMIKDGKKKSLPHVVTCECSLDDAVFTFMADSFSAGKDTSHPVCRFHRKLAPFKLAFAAGLTNAKAATDLLDMARLLAMDMKKEGIACFYPVSSDLGRKSLDSQLSKNNALGIPYTAVLNPESLKTGIFGLHNRETSLQEQLHISKFQEYGALLMKNY